ncbi:MAG: hypothetical protein QOC93_2884 [Actinomycetota bacterium]|nr:hypothetical protein [Actinomycetota bacterium]
MRRDRRRHTVVLTPEQYRELRDRRRRQLRWAAGIVVAVFLLCCCGSAVLGPLLRSPG